MRRSAGHATAGATAFAAFLLGVAPCGAAETEADTALGLPLSVAETSQARLFCLSALASAKTTRDPELTCDCFQLQWQGQTNRLHRMALSISLAPNSPQARSTLWAIGHLQDGLHEAKLEELSAAFQAAARQSLARCER